MPKEENSDASFTEITCFAQDYITMTHIRYYTITTGLNSTFHSFLTIVRSSNTTITNDHRDYYRRNRGLSYVTNMSVKVTIPVSYPEEC